MYVLKNVVGALASPLVFAAFFGVVAVLLHVLGRTRASKLWGMIAVVIAWSGSTELVGNALLGPLERQYPALVVTSMPGVNDIVVLGSSYAPRSDIPITGALEYDGLARIIEGVRLVKQFGSARLILSGGAAAGQVPSALGYRELASQLGVSDASMVVLDTPLDTRSEAVEISALFGAKPFILVTSAYHMPRAMQLMRAAGAAPIPAPTAQRVSSAASWSWRKWLPTSVGLRKTERALHEYLGLTASAMGIH